VAGVIGRLDMSDTKTVNAPAIMTPFVEAVRALWTEPLSDAARCQKIG
jgi:hypothetical protein